MERKGRFIIIFLIVAIVILVSLVKNRDWFDKPRLGRAPEEAIYYIVSSNENENYLPFWPYVKHNVEKLGMVPILIYTGKSKPKKKLKGRVVYKPCPPGLSRNNYAQIIRLFAPSLFPDKYCVIADIDSIPLKREYFTDPLRSLPQKNGWVFWNDWSLSPTCTNWPMCFNLAKGSVWAEVFPYSWDNINRVVKTWLDKRKGRQRFFTDQYYFGKHMCRWKKANPHRFKEYHQTIYNMFIGPRAQKKYFPRRMKVHHIKVCKTPEEIIANKHKRGVAWVSRPKDGMDKSVFKKSLKLLKL